MLDLLYLAIPTSLLVAGGLFFLKGNIKKIEVIFGIKLLLLISKNILFVLDFIFKKYQKIRADYIELKTSNLGIEDI